MNSLLDYAAVKARLPRLVTPRRLESLSREGLFPRFLRLTPRGPALWSADEIDEWIKARLGAPVAP